MYVMTPQLALNVAVHIIEPLNYATSNLRHIPSLSSKTRQSPLGRFLYFVLTVLSVVNMLPEKHYHSRWSQERRLIDHTETVQGVNAEGGRIPFCAKRILIIIN